MVGIYARVSTVKQKDNYSLGYQKRKGIEFAKSIGESYQVYEDAESGGSMLSRLELERMLNDIKNGLIKKVWAIEFTRLSRSVEDLQVLKKIFHQNNVELYIDGTLSDLTLADQRFIFNINAAVSEYERERIVERVIRGLSERKDLGITHSPQIYGYERKYDSSGNPYYVIIEEEARVIKTIYEKRRKGWSLNSIANHLNANQLPTKLNKKWRRKGISNILNHFIYTGYTTNSLGEVIESNLYPAIISIKEYKKTIKR